MLRVGDHGCHRHHRSPLIKISNDSYKLLDVIGPSSAPWFRSGSTILLLSPCPKMTRLATKEMLFLTECQIIWHYCFENRCPRSMSLLIWGVLDFMFFFKILFEHKRVSLKSFFVIFGAEKWKFAILNNRHFTRHKSYIRKVWQEIEEMNTKLNSEKNWKIGHGSAKLLAKLERSLFVAHSVHNIYVTFQPPNCFAASLSRYPAQSPLSAKIWKHIGAQLSAGASIISKEIGMGDQISTQVLFDVENARKVQRLVQHGVIEIKKAIATTHWTIEGERGTTADGWLWFKNQANAEPNGII